MNTIEVFRTAAPDKFGRYERWGYSAGNCGGVGHATMLDAYNAGVQKMKMQPNLEGK